MDQYAGLVKYGMDRAKPVGFAPTMHPDYVEGVKMVAGDNESSQPVSYARLIHPDFGEAVEMVAAEAESPQRVSFASFLFSVLVDAYLAHRSHPNTLLFW